MSPCSKISPGTEWKTRDTTVTTLDMLFDTTLPGGGDGGSDLEEGAGPEAVEVVAPSPAVALVVRAPAAAAPGVVAETDIAS